VVQAWPQDAFQAGGELGEQAADAVGGAVGLTGEVLVEADQHGQLPGDLIGQVEGARGVGHGAGGVRDVPGVLRVGLDLAGVEISDPPHRESGQVGDLTAGVPGDGQRQGADGGGLAHDHQNGAELGRELVEDGPQLRFAVRQSLGGPLRGDRLGPRSAGQTAPLPRSPHAGRPGLSRRSAARQSQPGRPAATLASFCASPVPPRAPRPAGGSARTSLIVCPNGAMVRGRRRSADSSRRRWTAPGVHRDRP
jgi:hypothetical protein